MESILTRKNSHYSKVQLTRNELENIDGIEFWKTDNQGFQYEIEAITLKCSISKEDAELNLDKQIVLSYNSTNRQNIIAEVVKVQHNEVSVLFHLHIIENQ